MVRDQGPRGWIGVDLDGTTFTYDKWVGWNKFGAPIAPMVARIRQWHEEGKEVRVVTARVGLPVFMGHVPHFSTHKWHTCYVTGEKFSDAMMVAAIQDHCVEHIGLRLPVQCWKDVHMIELWDDRAVQVIPNTGQTVAEEAEARYNAARGRVFQDMTVCSCELPGATICDDKGCRCTMCGKMAR